VTEERAHMSEREKGGGGVGGGGGGWGEGGGGGVQRSVTVEERRWSFLDTVR